MLSLHPLWWSFVTFNSCYSFSSEVQSPIIIQLETQIKIESRTRSIQTKNHRAYPGIAWSSVPRGDKEGLTAKRWLGVHCSYTLRNWYATTNETLLRTCILLHWLCCSRDVQQYIVLKYSYCNILWRIYCIGSSQEYNSILYWFVMTILRYIVLVSLTIRIYLALAIHTMTIYCIGCSAHSNTTMYCNNTITLCRWWYWPYDHVQSVLALQRFVLRMITICCLSSWDKNKNILCWQLQQYWVQYI